MRLTFAIPTWNRPKQLEICVRSIADQVRDGRTTIFISEDVDDAETTETIERLISDYGCIRHVRRDPRSTDYSDAFRFLFAQADGDWTWTFGDDDKLMPGALDFMLGHLESQPEEIQFMHVAERTRESGSPSAYMKGSLWTLCNSIGFTEMTGFITGNVVRSARLRHSVDTPRWRWYAKTAFVQSCCLLEELLNDQCGFLDMALVATQEKDQTEETQKRWQAQNISGRYIYLADAVELMYEDGILTQKVSKQFWRYLNLYMWGRYIGYMTADYINQGTLYTDDMWAKVIKMAQFLEDAEFAKQVISEIEAARGLCTLHSYMSRNLDGIKQELGAIAERNFVSVFPYSYIKGQEV